MKKLISTWLYIKSSNFWWRIIGSNIPKNGVLFIYRDNKCDRCCNYCEYLYELKEDKYFICSECYLGYKYTNFNFNNYIQNREIGNIKNHKKYYILNNIVTECNY